MVVHAFNLTTHEAGAGGLASEGNVDLDRTITQERRGLTSFLFILRQSHQASQFGLQLYLTFLLQPPEYLYHRCLRSCLASQVGEKAQRLRAVAPLP